jgi:hypothetical protein
MDGELPVSLLLIVSHHFVKRIANGWPLRAERPRAFGASPALKISFCKPYQFTTLRAHGLLEI